MEQSLSMTARLTTVHPGSVAAQHAVDADRVAGIVAHVEAVGKWDLPPVLVLEDEGNGCTVLDGHHRLAAAHKLDEQAIPAYEVSVGDYCRVLDARFGGSCPGRMSDLDSYIVLPDGTRYERSEPEDDTGIRAV